MQDPNLETYLKETETHFDYVVPKSESMANKLNLVSQFIIGYMENVFEFPNNDNATTFLVRVPDKKYKNISLVIFISSLDENKQLHRRANSHLNK